MISEFVRALGLRRQLESSAGTLLGAGDREAIAEILRRSPLERDRFGFHPAVSAMATAVAICAHIDTDRNMVLAVLLAPAVYASLCSIEEIERLWGEDVAVLVSGLSKVAGLYSHSAVVESDNFRKLLLTFAQDIRVIIIMIVDRLALMRAINHHPAEKLVKDIAFEANYLYAPLAHRLGLYAVKSELEDMSLKYGNREVYSRIARELKQTKARRESYIADFIAPVKEKLAAEGLKFEIKGRTKSIYSIWNKLKKQNNTLEEIYDLFAIRVVIDCEPAREKSECWLAYSLITDMYTPNPGRLKDWISIPKSNGYESLHITVKGPEERWVEVQIRTRRMDAVAEKGLAAHWMYKGIQAESNLDAWMNNVRDILEAAETGPMQLMRNFKMDVYSHEVFVFTPKGDLYKLPQGASVLDFAFQIHSNVGLHCVGARVDGRNRKINHRLASGDTVEIITSPQQEPSRDWLAWVVTSKARNKIRSVLKENANRTAELGRELLERRLRNRKLEVDESELSRIIARMGYKDAIAFFGALGCGDMEVNDVVEALAESQRRADECPARVSASTYILQPPAADTGNDSNGSEETIEIGDGVRGVRYQMSRCCNPLYGDSVFGFVASDGAIKIHRESCPNAPNMRLRYPYRLIKVRWSGGGAGQSLASVSVTGKDDIGIVTNITSIINKEKNVSLRSISIESDNGVFRGVLALGVVDTADLARIIKKISTVKGVKNVQRNM
ncbi:MAG: RelA/SpoT family protein [Muribaculaceae bacterium]|jgi:GTP pyrophosphokinase